MSSLGIFNGSAEISIIQLKSWDPKIYQTQDLCILLEFMILTSVPSENPRVTCQIGLPVVTMAFHAQYFAENSTELPSLCKLPDASTPKKSMHCTQKPWIYICMKPGSVCCSFVFKFTLGYHYLKIIINIVSKISILINRSCKMFLFTCLICFM